jgi:LuxR family maltose regulon positive regulatory protein
MTTQMWAWSTVVDTFDRRGFIARPALVDKLHNGARRPLTVLTAPAGYGKTSLLDEWALAHGGAPMARVTLRRDDTAHTVAARLAAAASELGAGMGFAALRHVPENAQSIGREFEDTLVRYLEALPGRILVVDGLDSPADAPLTDELGSVVERVARNLHVVVTRRSSALMSLPRAALSHVTHLGREDLALTPADVRLLILQVSGRMLTEDQLNALYARTEGWATVVQLAALGLRDTPDAQTYIANFTAVDRHIAAFLDAEILSFLPEEERRFLMRTSMLEELNGPLCDAVTGERGSTTLLASLERRGLVVRRAHDDGNWFAAHLATRDLLRHELRLAHPGAEQVMLGKAATWHLDHGQVQSAARYLIEAEDWDSLIQLVDHCGRACFSNSSAAEIVEWLDAIPGTADAGEPLLPLRRAYLCTMMGRTPQAEQELHALEGHVLSAGQRVVIEGLRASWAFLDSTPRAAMRAANATLDLLDDEVRADAIPDVFGATSAVSLRMNAQGSRARAHWLSGESDRPRHEFLKLARRRDASPVWRVRNVSALALLEAWAGNLGLALRRARKSLAIAEANGLMDYPAVLDAKLAVAHVHRERGDLYRADELLQETLHMVSLWRRPHTLAIHAVESALWHLAAGDPARGLRVIDRVRTSGERRPPPAIDHRLLATEALLLVALGDVHAAETALQEGAIIAPQVGAAAVQTAFAHGDLAAALERHHRWTLEGGTPRLRLDHELWAAILEFQCGRRRQGLKRFTAVVEDAEQEGHVRLFLDSGPAAETLLHARLRANPTPYLRHLVGFVGPGPQATRGHTIAGLSERELEIVRFLPTPLSSAEIAAQLYVSLNTLKTHLRTIYRKLGVHTRPAAISKAQELGLA